MSSLIYPLLLFVHPIVVDYSVPSEWTLPFKVINYEQRQK